MSRWTLLFGALTLSLAACGDPKDEEETTDEMTDMECPDEDPSIDSFTLDATTVAAGATLHGTIAVTGFELGGHDEEMEGMEGMEGMECPGGHAHIYLDDLTGNPLTMAMDTEFDVVLPGDIPAGMHMLIARLHNHDHTIVDPEVTAEAHFTVE